MKDIVFTKYSNERADKFRIRTDIVEDSDGINYVWKSALTEECHEHINNIYTNYNLLSKVYINNPEIHVTECKKVKEWLEFEYVPGETFEQELDTLLLNDSCSEVLKRIKQYISTVFFLTEKSDFIKTEGFIKVFGNANLSTSLKCSRISNIDLIFSNIIRKDKWNIIDYEWVFDFPVPDNYIIYRAIKIYVEGSSKRNKLKQFELYTVLGFTENEVEEYSKMECNFIKYVMGETIQLYTLYNEIQKNNIDINGIISEKQKEMCDNFTQIFYNYGDSFNEKDSYVIYNDIEQPQSKIEIDIEKNVTQLRVDPGNKECIIHIKNVIAWADTDYSIDFHTNGLNLGNKTILFYHDDPQIIFSNIKNKTNKIQIEFIKEVISRDVADSIRRLINNNHEIVKEYENKIEKNEQEIEEYKQGIKKNKQEIEEYKKEVKKYDSELMEIKNSRGWKLLSYVHKIKDKL